jgi:23S rRNA (cytidine1920-2'-O)/16S rRNA (cytidine1409-2'-O)-methyltransferase
VTREQVPEEIGFASVDVSFISLSKILGPAHELLSKDGQMVCLIKPQFEAGKEKVGKKGVVRDKNVHLEVIENVIGFARELGFKILDLSYSPIKGPEGNIEYLLHIAKDTSDIEEREVVPQKIVELAHGSL